MACNCKNEDGTLSQRCFGTCLKKEIIDQEIQQQRDPLNGFAEMIIAQVDKRIDYALNNFNVKLQKDWFIESSEIFLEGFKEGYNFHKDNGYE